VKINKKTLKAFTPEKKNEKRTYVKNLKENVLGWAREQVGAAREDVVPFVERNRQSEKIWVGLQCHQLRKVLNSNTEVKTKNSKCWYTTEKRNKKKIVQRNEKYVFGGTRKKGKTDLVV